MSFQGLLNDVCNILERTQMQDALGQQTDQLNTVAQGIKCAFQNSGGGLDRSGRIQAATNSDRLYLMPLNFEIKKHFHIVEVRGERFNITEITDLGGRKRYLRLNLERVTLND